MIAMMKFPPQCFHSINFPSEWGEKLELLKTTRKNVVSIQLISPASGELRDRHTRQVRKSRFHSINFPSEWGVGKWFEIDPVYPEFPFN